VSSSPWRDVSPSGHTPLTWGREDSQDERGAWKGEEKKKGTSELKRLTLVRYGRFMRLFCPTKLNPLRKRKRGEATAQQNDIRFRKKRVKGEISI